MAGILANALLYVADSSVYTLHTHTPRFCVPTVPHVTDAPNKPDEPDGTSVSRPSRAHPTRPTSPITHAVAYSKTHPLSHGLEESVIVDVGAG